MNEEVGNKQEEQESIIGITADVLIIALIRLVEDTSKGNGPSNAPHTAECRQEVRKKCDTQVGLDGSTRRDQICCSKRNAAPDKFGIA